MSGSNSTKDPECFRPRGPISSNSTWSETLCGHRLPTKMLPCEELDSPAGPNVDERFEEVEAWQKMVMTSKSTGQIQIVLTFVRRIEIHVFQR